MAVNDQFAGWRTQSTTSLLQRGSMDKPREGFSWPSGFNQTAQVQQLRVNAQPSPVSTLRSPRVQNSVPSVPKPVTGIRVIRAVIPGTNNVRVNVHFNRDPADVAFQSANVYLKQANGMNNIVGTTSATQSTFVVPRTSASSVVTVQSVGTGSAVPVGNSPSRSVNLS
jgi:hypothetical protein